jgi:hypothetical protein
LTAEGEFIERVAIVREEEDDRGRQVFLGQGTRQSFNHGRRCYTEYLGVRKKAALITKTILACTSI